MKFQRSDRIKFVPSLVFLSYSISFHSQPRTNHEDLNAIVGRWEGVITYLDYRTNEPFSMPANLIVEKAKGKRLGLYEPVTQRAKSH